jgi:hypothetical protein
MRSRAKAIAGTACAAAVGLLLAATPAAADHHLVRISEIHHESDTSSSGDWVELQFLTDGQNLLATHYLQLYDVAGGALPGVALSTVPSGGSQRTVLIGSGAVAGADQNNAGARVFFAGTACYDEGATGIGGIDCVRWGASTVAAGTSPTGTPATQLAPGETLQRTLGRGCPTQLDAADDSDDSAADFSLAPGSPRNNATSPTETACPTPPADPGPAGSSPVTSSQPKKKCRKKAKKHSASAAKKKCKKKR